MKRYIKQSRDAGRDRLSDILNDIKENQKQYSPYYRYPFVQHNQSQISSINRLFTFLEGKDLWAKLYIKHGTYSNRAYWIKVVSHTNSYWNIIKINDYIRGDYLALKLSGKLTERLSKANTDKIRLYEPFSIYPTSDLVDTMRNDNGFDRLENPEGYALAKGPKGYYWHWLGGDEDANEGIIHYMPLDDD